MTRKVIFENTNGITEGNIDLSEDFRNFDELRIWASNEDSNNGFCVNVLPVPDFLEMFESTSVTDIVIWHRSTRYWAIVGKLRGSTYTHLITSGHVGKMFKIVGIKYI